MNWTNPKKFCVTCHAAQTPKVECRGGGVGGALVAMLLFFLGILPGLIYLAWQHSTKREVCRECGATTLVPVTSPVARKAMA